MILAHFVNDKLALMFKHISERDEYDILRAMNTIWTQKQWKLRWNMKVEKVNRKEKKHVNHKERDNY